MSQVVEIAWTPLKGNAVEETIKVWGALGSELKAQKGLNTLYYGQVVEKPNSVECATSKFSPSTARRERVFG